MATTSDNGEVASTGFVNDWQAGKTLPQCNRHMLETEAYCDVIFRSENPDILIHAHRYILVSRSCVLHATLSDNLAVKSEVTIPAESSDAFTFKQFLVYLYTDSTVIDTDNASSLLYLSRKYSVTKLEDMCLDFFNTEKIPMTNTPEEHKTSSNVNWQARMSLSQCNMHMLNTEDGCDVTFLVGSEHHVIKAHRYVLISRSCVFDALLSDDPATSSDVSVPDMTPDHFQQFLIYLYTDDTSLDSDNATVLLHAARKYAVTLLEGKCLQFLQRNLSVDNACGVLDIAYRYEYKELFEAALLFVKGQGQRCLQSQGFLMLSKELVDQIILSSDLIAFNHVVFHALDRWSEFECQRQGREITKKSKKAVLGRTLEKMTFNLDSSLVQELRAARMLSHVQGEQYRCRSDGSKADLFSQFECLNILENTSSESQMIDKAPKKTEDVLTPCYQTSDRRYKTTRYCYTYYGFSDAILFRCNKKISLHGFQLYGPLRGSANYDVITNILGNNDISLPASVLDCSCVVNDNEEVFDVMYKAAVAIKAGVWYTLVVKILGPDSRAGYGGNIQVHCPDGVVLDFRNSERSKNGTSVTVGQIPALVYSLG
ncbi:BTB/POZ domain-containing protein 6-like isoform X2 [Haliotis rubra]|nr:BTB/POZ domain-containing protein 6-like isoform X2 [Haliotis rubra]XP_046573823.1 BTB/POZ domain-containing protein 6-like isoform X2 [Haliotis rubra]XP_046573824.1 BTB/POZ domain-containing protein 6-like isoform X2 [Haliotis rubra]XP_046573825.1 BTB/POZ domain-containing protein 6-like isoform X2 [Haliotis rubra]